MRSCLLLAVLFLPALQAQEVEFGDIRVRKLPELPAGATHGYHEFAFLVTNASPTAPHEIVLEAPNVAGRSPWPHSLRRIRQGAVVPPLSTLRMTLLQPALPIAGSDIRVLVDGRPLRDYIPLASAHPNESHLYGMGSGSVRQVLISQRVVTGQTAAAGTGATTSIVIGGATVAVPVPSPLGRPAVPAAPVPLQRFAQDQQQALRAVTPVSDWSADWLAYSGYDGIVLDARELVGVDAAVRAALWRYAEAGGSLAVVSGADSDGGGLRQEMERYGWVEETALRVAYPGLGVSLWSDRGLEELSDEQFQRLDVSWRKSRAPWNLTQEPATVHRFFPVIAEINVPVRGVFLVVVAFTVLIGPVNMLLLHRWRRRIWLLWTVPAASLVATLIVILYSILSEGLIEKQKSASVTVLDQRFHRASTLGWRGFYSTLTPSGAFSYARDTEVSAVTEWDLGQPSGGSRALDWSSTQDFASGWVRARLPAYFMLRKSELRRERLRIRRAADGGLEAVNGLGAEILGLHVADHDGKIHAAVAVAAAGAGVRLEATGDEAAGTAATPRELYRANLPSRLLLLEQEPQGFLQPATYVARLAGSPFLDPGKADFERDDVTLVYGLLEEIAGEGEP